MATNRLGEITDAGRQTVASDDRQTLPLHAETTTVTKRISKTSVKAIRTTSAREVAVDEELAREQVIVERVAVGRVVDEVPPVRQEGDVTILPIVEEEIVVTRRLVLREEVHLRRIHITHRHTETVTLRDQTVSVTRTPLEDETTGIHPVVRTTPQAKVHP